MENKPKVEVVPPTPAFMDMSNQVQPAAVPQLPWGKLFVARWLHNWQAGDVEKSYEIGARIAEHQKNQQTSQIEMIIGMTTMMNRYQAETSEYNARTAGANHMIEMMSLEKQSKMLENQLKLAELNADQLELKVKERELRDVLAESEIGTEG